MKINITPRIEIRMDEIPTSKTWALTPLYKISASGDYFSWQIAYDGHKYLELYDGYNNERKLSSTVVPQEDPLVAARKLYIARCQEGYHIGSEMIPLNIQGMKGYDYKPNSITNFPVYIQPKLNGIRMLASMNHQTLSLRSWLNNPFTNLTHLHKDIIDFFRYLPADAVLDGELYHHDLLFTTITSAVKTSSKIHPALSLLQFHIFDIYYISGGPYEHRYSLLQNAYTNFVTDRGSATLTFAIVPVHNGYSSADIVNFHDYYVAKGYEGIMIKKLANGADSDSKQYKESLYKAGKCNHIIKYKDFIDEEAIVIDVNEYLVVRDRRGYTYPLQTKMAINEHLRGKEVTIRYREFLPNGVPKCPIVVAVRDYEILRQ